MSTYIYLECQDHIPHIRAREETGQHLSDLPDLFEMIKNRTVLVRARRFGVLMDDAYKNTAVSFLSEHPNCSIEVFDEYGVHYPFPRPDGCCGVCPEIKRGGYDCTCEGNEDCK